MCPSFPISEFHYSFMLNAQICLHLTYTNLTFKWDTPNVFGLLTIELFVDIDAGLANIFGKFVLKNVHQVIIHIPKTSSHLNHLPKSLQLFLVTGSSNYMLRSSAPAS